MSAACPAPAIDADFEEVGEQRRTDRRQSDRRAPRMKLDPMFAATLVNQIARVEDTVVRGYPAPKSRVRAGISVNLSA